MNFLSPLALGLGLLSGLIVLMYLLKLRRKRVEFSSTLLWMKSMEDLTANAPFQKLRQNLLMYLQILMVLLLALALAKPTMWLNKEKGNYHILLIDNSASMNATDGADGGSRLEEAQGIAREMMDNLVAGDQMMVVTFGGKVRVVQPFTSERATLASAIRGIEPTDAEAQIRPAIQLAQGTRKANPNAVITIVSDGGVGYLGNAVTEGEQLAFMKVGSSDDNRGFVSFDLRESFEREGEVQIFAEVENFGSSAADVMVRAVIDDRTVDVMEYHMEPGDRQGFIFENLQGASRKAVRIELVGADMLASDDTLYGWLDLGSATTVLLVTHGNLFLESIFAVMNGLEVSKMAPEDFEPTGAYDLIVFDQFVPQKLGPGRYLIIDEVPPLAGFEAAQEPATDQIVMDWHRLHPISRFVNFGEQYIPEAIAITSPDWMTTLMESPETPLIQAGEYQGVKLVWIGFDPIETYWPLDPSFPIFFSNAVNWLTVQGAGSLTGNYTAGQLVTLTAEGEIEVRGPDGKTWTLEGNENGTAFFSETHRAGIYEVRGDGETIGEFAVNLISPLESDIAPLDSIVSGEQVVAAGNLQRENRGVWHWFAIAGLAILVVEWHLYCRRAWL